MKFDWEQNEKEFLLLLQNSCSKSEACRLMANKHNISLSAVKSKLNRMQKNNPQRKLPKGTPGKEKPVVVTVEVLRDSNKVAELLDYIKKLGTRQGGMEVFAKNNGLSFFSVRNVFYQNILTPEIDRQLPGSAKKEQTPVQSEAKKEQVIPVQWAISEVVAKKELPLEKKDIQAAADKAGVHYHTALSTWGAMSKKNQQNQIGLEQILEMYEIIAQQSKKIAELEAALSAARRVSVSSMEMLARKNKRLAQGKPPIQIVKPAV